jgi:hypothetical protein
MPEVTNRKREYIIMKPILLLRSQMTLQSALLLSCQSKKRSCDPCCCIKNVEGRLVIYLSWVDDCLFLGKRDDVIGAADEMKLFFEFDKVGFTDNYVGCKINMNNNKGE